MALNAWEIDVENRITEAVTARLPIELPNASVARYYLITVTGRSRLTTRHPSEVASSGDGLAPKAPCKRVLTSVQASAR